MPCSNGWVKLRDEYLIYQQKLAEASHHSSEIASHLPTSPTYPPMNTTNGGMNTDDASSSNTAPSATVWTQRPSKPASALEAPLYPLGSLVFVKNVHTQTNKTTLKQLLSSAFSETVAAEGVTKGKEVDYVDYQKNMDAVSYQGLVS